jgi:hypothetical protein
MTFSTPIRHLLLILAAALGMAPTALAQYDASTLQGKSPCTANRTRNCIPTANSSGVVSIPGTLSVAATVSGSNILRSPEQYTGGTDQAKAEAAIAAIVAAGGGVLHIPRRATLYSVSNLAIPSNVHVRCDIGAGFTNTTLHGRILLFSAVTSAGVSDCTFVGPGATLPAEAGDGVPVVIANSTFITVEDCNISAFEYAGIWATTATNSNLALRRNYIHGGYDSSAYEGGTATADILIDKTTNDSAIEDNILVSPNDVGVMVQPSAGTSSRIAVRRNRISGKHLYGVLFYNAGGNIVKSEIKGNTITDISSRSNGVYTMSYGMGIYLVDVDDNTIEGNTLDTTLQGRTDTTLARGAISVSEGDRNQIINNTIRASGYHGIHVLSSPATVVSGGYVQGSAYTGLLIASSPDTQVSGGIYDGSGNSNSGVDVAASLRTVVNGVTVRNAGSGGYGIGFQIELGSDGTVVSNSSAYLNGCHGFDIASANITISNNVANSNAQANAACVGFHFVAAAALSKVLVVGNRALFSHAFGFKETGNYSDITFIGNQSANSVTGEWSIATAGYRAVANLGLADN